MSNYIVALDPAAAITGRTELQLNASSGINVNQEGIDWGEAAIKAFLAEQEYGETMTQYRVPNRTVTIPFGLGMTGEGLEETARAHLLQKVGLLQRQGGVLLRQREGGEPLYADIVYASLTLPDVYGEVGGVEPGGSLKLECRPDFYGEEETLDAITTGEGQIVAVLQKSGSNAVIKGDYPARGRIVVTEKQKAAQRSLLWGLRSTHYSSGEHARLYLDAYTTTKINGSKEVVLAGTYSGKALELPAAEQFAGKWQPFMTTDVSGVHLSHVGSYRVWARVKTATVGQKLRLLWGVADPTALTTNPEAELIEGWQMVDLGEVRIEEPPVNPSEMWWRAVLQVNTPTQSALQVDRIWFQPLDDGAGKLRATATNIANTFEELKVNNKSRSEPSSPKPLWFPLGSDVYQVTLGAGGSEAFSTRLVLTEYKFAPLAGGVIRGIQIGVNYSNNAGIPVGVRVVPQTAAGQLPQADEIYGKGGNAEFGGPTDLWGSAIKPTEVKEVGFGMQIEVYQASSTPCTVYVTPYIIIYWGFAEESTPADAVLYPEKKTHIRSEGAFRQDTSSGAFGRVSEETGDLIRIPPSGLEGRVCELFVKNSRGVIPGIQPPVRAETDPNIDKLEAQVVYRPCFIGRI